MNYSFKAIIFDLDGTLLNTLDDLANSMNHVLEIHGFPIYLVDQYRLLVGEGMYKLVLKAATPYTNDLELINLMFLQMNETYKKNWHHTTKPYPKIIEVLNLLSNVGFHLYVLSNKPEHFTKETVAYFFPKIPFDSVLGATDDMPRKPDPAGVEKIITNSGLSPNDFLMIGDSGIDMNTALNANIMAGGVLWGFRDKEELIQSGANFIFSHPDEIYALLINSNEFGYNFII